MPTCFPNKCDVLKIFKTEVPGGTAYSDVSEGNYEVITGNLSCSIQSASPTEIEDFSSRNVKVGFKVYSPSNPNAVLGNIIRDTRYDPPVYYIVRSPAEDLAGRRRRWGLFCDQIV